MSILIDFKELEAASSVRGEALEQLTRKLGDRVGCLTSWAGRGSDRGRDIYFIENLSGPIYKTKITWLVSCKDHAKSGASVSPGELAEPGVLDKVEEHKADGFMLVTTTTASTNTKETLDKLDKSNGGRIYTHVWDGSDLAHMLLKPENQDLLQQFFPQSYQRVKGLTSVESLLLASSERLPAPILEEVLRLVRPYTDSPLKGSIIWPYSSSSADEIDKIVKCLLIDGDVEKAVTSTEQIEFDAFIAFVDALYNKESEACYKYLAGLVHQHYDPDVRYNALQNLLENYEVSPEDRIDLAQTADFDMLNLLFEEAEIEGYVGDEVFTTFSFEIHRSLAEVFTSYEIKHASAYNVHLQLGQDKQINFTGLVDVDVIFLGSDEWGKSYRGSFKGYFDAYGMCLESVVLDDAILHKGDNLAMDI